jgi:hypothetical protein
VPLRVVAFQSWVGIWIVDRSRHLQMKMTESDGARPETTSSWTTLPQSAGIDRQSNFGCIRTKSVLMAKGEHVLLGAGSDTRPSNMTLASVNRFLTSKREDLIVDGLVDSCAIYVDNQGNYFTNRSAVQLHRN